MAYMLHNFILVSIHDPCHGTTGGLWELGVHVSKIMSTMTSSHNPLSLQAPTFCSNLIIFKLNGNSRLAQLQDKDNSSIW